MSESTKQPKQAAPYGYKAASYVTPKLEGLPDVQHASHCNCRACFVLRAAKAKAKRDRGGTSLPENVNAEVMISLLMRVDLRTGYSSSRGMPSHVVCACWDEVYYSERADCVRWLITHNMLHPVWFAEANRCDGIAEAAKQVIADYVAYGEREDVGTTDPASSTTSVDNSAEPEGGLQDVGTCNIT